ncbi:hypothetical protein [Mesorhizobium sp.]|uniref:hypothetical protein n=1 Tax=Mesorhizobium sp. TaxID=1871066 RepID=UPI0025FB2EC6|nr:hypothetical protein [Mesorhizobium sp.]
MSAGKQQPAYDDNVDQERIAQHLALRLRARLETQQRGIRRHSEDDQRGGGEGPGHANSKQETGNDLDPRTSASIKAGAGNFCAAR